MERKPQVMLSRISILLILTVLSLAPAWAQEEGESQELSHRKRLAAVDTRLAASWIAGSYEVPERVPQELLYKGYSYAETLVALAYMGEGLSLNEVLEQRRLRGAARWDEVAKALEFDTARLAKPVSELLWFGRNSTTPPVIHFLPDPHPGITRDLVIPAFEPTVPSPVLVRRFRLNQREVENIRKVLDDPLGGPEEDLHLPAGRGLTTADWVMAGTFSYFKPFPMESMLAARVGEDLPWSEVALAFGFRPDVLTQGPLSGVYPILTGYADHTILIARNLTKHPESLPLRYDLERLTPGEKRALQPLMHHYYKTSVDEKKWLKESGLEMAEQGLALSLARMSTLPLDVILKDHAELKSWHGIVTKYAIDMTGHPELVAVMELRS